MTNAIHLDSNKVVAYQIPKVKHADGTMALTLTLEDGVELELMIDIALAYNFGSKLRKRIEQANHVPEGGNGEKYSNFYGMQY